MVGSGFRSELFFRIRIQNTNLYIATKFEDFFCGLNYFGRSADQTHICSFDIVPVPVGGTAASAQQLDRRCAGDIPAESSRALSCQVGSSVPATGRKMWQRYSG